MDRFQLRRLRLRRFHYAAAIVLALMIAAPGSGVFTEAAGPGRFFSRLWDSPAQIRSLSTTKLNPRNWVAQPQTVAGASRETKTVSGTDRSTVQTSANGTAVLSTRPALYADPFAVADDAGSPVGPHHPSDSSLSRTSPLTAAPSPRQRRLNARPHHNFVSGQTTGVNAATDRDSLLPAGPDAGRQHTVNSGQDLLTPPTRSQLTGQTDREFDRLIRSVIRESAIARAAGKSSAGRSSLPQSGTRRGSVEAPRPVDFTTSPSVFSSGPNAVDERIDDSQQEMTAAHTDPAGRRTPPLIMELPQRPPVSLSEASGHGGPHLLHPPTPMLVPSDEAADIITERQQAAFPSRSDDFRNDWEDHGKSETPVDSQAATRSAAARTPRVISNAAPLRSVPNNRQYQRLAYKSELTPLLPGDDSTDAIPDSTVSPGRPFSPVIDRSTADLSSGPIIDWSLDEDLNESTHGTAVPWGFASVLVTAVTTLIAILLLRKRQVVTAVTSGTRDIRETS